jgi:hypothetical protein
MNTSLCPSSSSASSWGLLFLLLGLVTLTSSSESESCFLGAVLACPFPLDFFGFSSLSSSLSTFLVDTGLVVLAFVFLGASESESESAFLATAFLTGCFLVFTSSSESESESAFFATFLTSLLGFLLFFKRFTEPELSLATDTFLFPVLVLAGGDQYGSTHLRTGV